MKKSYLCLLLSLLSFPTWADVNLEPLLNTVTLQLQTEEWVTTKTVLAYVNVDAAVTDQGLEKIQDTVMQKLGQISSQGEWHIMSFIRMPDKTGLESVHILAEIRLPQAEVANLRTKAKALSKPGEAYELKNIQYVPSEAEIQQVNTKMRSDLYSQAKAEIDAINKLYPDQKYYLHSINFISQVMPLPMPMMAQEAGAMNNMAALRMKSSSAPLSVGNKANLQATVVLAAMPDVVSQKLAKP